MPPSANASSNSKVLETFKVSAPVNLDGLAKALGIELATDRSLPDEVSVQIERTGKSGFKVTVNARQETERRRFSLANAIAHVKLHPDWITEKVIVSRGYQSNLGAALEHAAHRYALELLMPADLVRRRWSEGARSIVEIALIFAVSTEAARIHLAALGLK